MFLRISINLQSIKQFSLHSFMCFLLLFPLLPPLFRLPLHIYLLTHFSSGPLSTLKRQQIGSVRRGQTVRFVFSDCYLPCHLMYIHTYYAQDEYVNVYAYQILVIRIDYNNSTSHPLLSSVEIGPDNAHKTADRLSIYMNIYIGQGITFIYNILLLAINLYYSTLIYAGTGITIDST